MAGAAAAPRWATPPWRSRPAGRTRVVCWRARNRGSGGRPWAGTGAEVGGDAQFSIPFGLVRPVDQIAMLARRHMFEYGTTSEQLGAVAVAFRKHAARNPACDDARADHARGSPGLAHGLRSAAQARLLPGDRRRAGRGADLARARARSEGAPRRGARRGAGNRAGARGDDQLPRAAPARDAFAVGRARALGARGGAALRHRLRAVLRRLHAARDLLAGGVRLLQAGGGRALLRGRPARVAGRESSPATPAAAGSPRPTSTAST